LALSLLIFFGRQQFLAEFYVSNSNIRLFVFPFIVFFYQKKNMRLGQ
jgi:hypothetical protein